MHRAVEEACREHGRTDEIGSRIEYLRRAYAVEKREGPPRFTDEETRLAYAVAYHPAHAFAYLHVLLRRGIGRTVFGGMRTSPRVLVLGAGPGAETLAMLRWMETSSPELMKGARFVLVDRAEWEPTRRTVLAPTVRRSWKANRIVFDQVTSDVATDEGESFLVAEAGRADVIFCPSILSEMISERTQNQLLETLNACMDPGARLVLIDHKDLEFEHVTRQWSNRFDVIDEGSSTGVILPPPSRWVAMKLLDGRDNRIPTRSYPLAWTVLGRRG